MKKALVSESLSPTGTCVLWSEATNLRSAQSQRIVMRGGQPVLFRSLMVRRLLDLGKRRYCRPIESRAIGCELGSVTRAIPALLERIPVHDAAEMRAAGGVQMQLFFLVP